MSLCSSSKLPELFATERCGDKQYQQGQNWFRKVHGHTSHTWTAGPCSNSMDQKKFQKFLESWYKWILGLSREVLFKIPSTMILDTRKVEGEWIAEGGQAYMLLLTIIILPQREKNTGLDQPLF